MDPDSVNAEPGEVLPVDVLIVGGGVAGLWTLDVLRRAGLSCVLLEHDALGTGQTVGSQGIVHGGLKYTLSGTLTGSAQAIRDMPLVWREALEGKPGRPDASATRMRSQFCHLWRTGRWSSRLGMVGARVGLRVKPKRIEREAWPAVLRGVGDVFRLEEQVVDPASFVSALAGLHPECMIKTHGEPTIVRDAMGVKVWGVSSGDQALRFAPRWVALTAGLGNAALRELAGITESRMQRRGVHMILAREAVPGSGVLPELNGHCVDGQKTRVTITTDRDAPGEDGRRVWQIGGQVSEDGTEMDADTLIRHAMVEVSASLGGRDVTTGVAWSTYRLDKAEVTTAGGLRPDDAFVERSGSPASGARGNVLTCWPTKLALAPRVAELVLEHAKTGYVPETSNAERLAEALRSVERPSVAPPPWAQPRDWVSLASHAEVTP
ncbi:MAG: FAD-dependent oxidoreductase [Planctomycetota bacterium]